MLFAETVAALLAAHLIADFTFQPNWLVKAKAETKWGLVLHIAVVLGVSILVLGNCSWRVLLVIGVSHALLDATKIFLLPRFPKLVPEPDGVWPFAIDQFAHMAFIVIVGVVWPKLFETGWWVNQTSWGVPKDLRVTATFNISDWYMGALVLVSGLILCIPVGGILIGKITNGMIGDDEDDDQEDEHEDDDGEDDEAADDEVADDVDGADATANAIEKAATAIETAAAAYTNSLAADLSPTTTDDSLSEQDETKIEHILRGLPGGGRYIGWLERILVMLFVLSGYPQGIGFLIAAKSILRFGDIKNWHQRAATEYVIIGTFLSFAWAMIVAGLTQQALQLWFPPKPPPPTVIMMPSDVMEGITAAPGPDASGVDTNEAAASTNEDNANKDDNINETCAPSKSGDTDKANTQTSSKRQTC